VKTSLLIPENTKRRVAGGRLLPLAADNIFTRIIRNPLRGSTAIRERQCAEMLAGLLINAPVTRKCFCQWLATLSGVRVSELEGCEFLVSTEQQIAGKRDDLRIEGWQTVGCDRVRVILWTIEVKVTASFHSSSDINSDLDAVAMDSDPELVNQVRNYDYWLSNQTTAIKGGFVLAIEDMTPQLPGDLRQHWKCMTWTGTGIMLRNGLRDHLIPPDERTIARHVLGFIADHFWRNAEVPESRLEFEDVAMLRAWSMMADDCEAKIHTLVTPLRDMLSDFPVGVKDVKRDKLFAKWGKYALGRILVADKSDKVPTLWAGVTVDRNSDGAEFCVWIESPPHSRLKRAIRSLHSALVERHPWESNDGNGEWWDVWWTTPLTNLLAADDQSGKLREFVKAALEDLDKAGLVSVIKGKRNGK